MKLFWGYALDRQSKRLVYNTGDSEDVIAPATTGEVMQILQEIARAAASSRRTVRTAISSTSPRAARPRARAVCGAGRGPARRRGGRLRRSRHRARASDGRALPRVSHQLGARHASRTAGAEDGVAVTAETCPHYLLFVAADCEGRDAAMKAFPPVREDVRSRGALAGGRRRDHRVARIGPRPSHARRQVQAVRDRSGGHGGGRDHGTPHDRPHVRRQDHGGALELGPQRGHGPPVRAVSAQGRDRARRGRRHDPGRPVGASGRSAARSCTACSGFTPLEGTELRGAPVNALLRGAVVMSDREPVGEARGRLVRREASRARRMTPPAVCPAASTARGRFRRGSEGRGVCRGHNQGYRTEFDREQAVSPRLAAGALARRRS